MSSSERLYRDSMKNIIVKYLPLKALALVVAVATANAFSLVAAQDQGSDAAPQEPSFELEELIVTARKKDETASDIPISISVFGEGEIKGAGITDIRDVAELTPGLQFSGDFGRAAERPVIRGISNLRPETAQPVSLFIDGVYVRSGLISSIVEGVERIEVLKGPQAALYGRSTYGGVVNYITKRPSEQTVTDLSVTVAEHGNLELNGFLAGKISDSISGTVGFRSYEFDGEFDNNAQFTEGARRVGSEQTRALYGSLNFTPNDRFEFIARAYFSSDEDGQFAGQLVDSRANNSVADGGTGCPANVAISYYCGEAQSFDSVNISTAINQGEIIPVGGLGFPIIAQWDFRAGLDRDIDRFTTSLAYDISDDLKFEWLAGYTKEDLRIVTNQSYSPVIVGNSFGFFPSAWVTDDKSERDYYSNEIRLSGGNDTLDWLVGAFLYHEELSVVDRNILQPDLEFDQEREDEELSFFARLGWQVNDKLALSLEGRQSREDISSLAVAGGAALENDFSSFNPRFTIDYKLNESTLFYGNIARGSKAGGFNPVNPDDPNELPFLSFDEEVVLQYEAGVKTRFFDGAMGLNAALYLLDLTDQQLSQVVILNEGTPDQTQITVVQNVGESEVNGVEVDYTWDISPNWYFAASYALADTEIIAGSDATQAQIFGGNGSLAGFKIPRVSEHSATTSLKYTRPLSGNWALTTRVDGIFNSSRYAQTANLQETGDQTKVNLRIGAANDNMDITFWVDNVFDDDTPANVFRYVDPGDFRFFRRAYTSFLSRGRQAGVTFRYSM